MAGSSARRVAAQEATISLWSRAYPSVSAASPRSRTYPSTCPGPHRLDHRPERRRQDVAAQHDLRLLQARLRPHFARRPRHHPETAERDRRARRGAHVPEHRAVQRPHRARQPDARPPCADAIGRAQVRAVLGPGPARGNRHRAACEEIIDFLKLQDLRKQPTAALAYGLRKRVELGRALALEPKVLLLDEPMGGMNQDEKEDMARYILDVNQERGITVVLIEHDMGVVMDISDRVVVLDRGRAHRRRHTGGGPARSILHLQN